MDWLKWSCWRALRHQAAYKSNEIWFNGARRQRNLISLMGWLLFLWGGYGRQQAAKGSAKERERSKQPINESNGAERQKKVSEINHSSLNWLRNEGRQPQWSNQWRRMDWLNGAPRSQQLRGKPIQQQYNFILPRKRDWNWLNCWNGREGANQITLWFVGGRRRPILPFNTFIFLCSRTPFDRQIYVRRVAQCLSIF